MNESDYSDAMDKWKLGDMVWLACPVARENPDGLRTIKYEVQLQTYNVIELEHKIIEKLGLVEAWHTLYVTVHFDLGGCVKTENAKSGIIQTGSWHPSIPSLLSINVNILQSYVDKWNSQASSHQGKGDIK